MAASPKKNTKSDSTTKKAAPKKDVAKKAAAKKGPVSVLDKLEAEFGDSANVVTETDLDDTEDQFNLLDGPLEDDGDVIDLDDDELLDDALDVDTELLDDELLDEVSAGTPIAKVRRVKGEAEDDVPSDDDDDDDEDSNDVEVPLDAVLAAKLHIDDDDDDDDDEEDGTAAPVTKTKKRKHALVIEDDEEEDDDEFTDVIPKRDDEFHCHSCYLVKARVQLADPVNMLCRDCV